jgi:hypothetical protein
MVVMEQGLAALEGPSAYAFSVLLGEMFLQGIRFTQPGTQLHLETEQDFAQIWPVNGHVEWPHGEPVTDATLRRVQKGLNLYAVQPSLRVLPFGPAVDLPRSTAEGLTVRLPTPCGKHHIFYPRRLVDKAAKDVFYAFTATCECPKAYLVHTESDGATFKAEGPVELIEARYLQLPGTPIQTSAPGLEFSCKKL